MTDLAAAQAAVVAAVTGTGRVPPGFDPHRVEVARRALVRKRAGGIRATWPALAAALGDDLESHFARWAADRPTRGALHDGWELARIGAAAGLLDLPARAELAERTAAWIFDAERPPRRRRMPSVQRFRGGWAVAAGGRARVWSTRH